MLCKVGLLTPGLPPQAAERSAAAPSSTSQAAEASKGDTSPGGSTLHTIFGRLLRTQSGHLLRSNSASQTPTCLICLECLAPEDFEVSAQD